MAATVVSASFEGDVLSLHVFFGGHEISLTQNGSKWTGKRTMDVSGKLRAELTFKSPTGTDYTFVLKAGSKKVVDDEDTNDAPLFSRGYDVDLSNA
jgi:hypothetical protein